MGSLKSKTGVETGTLEVLSSEPTVIEFTLLTLTGLIESTPISSDLMFLKPVAMMLLTLVVRRSPTTRRYRIAPKLQVSALIVIY